MSERWIGWHFLTAKGLTFYGDLRPVPGECLRVKGRIRIGRRGLHASARAMDALQLSRGPVVERVELIGKREDLPRQSCARTRRCLWLADATTVLHEFACDIAERALETAGNAHPASLAAIATKRRWLKGEATGEELRAAMRAAWTAAARENRARRADTAGVEAGWAAVNAMDGDAVVAASDTMFNAIEAADTAYIWAINPINADLHARLMALAPEGYTEEDDAHE